MLRCVLIATMCVALGALSSGDPAEEAVVPEDNFLEGDAKTVASGNAGKGKGGESAGKSAGQKGVDQAGPSFKKVSGEACSVTDDGDCIQVHATDGHYGDDKRCEFQVTSHAKLKVIGTFCTERGYDELTVSNPRKPHPDHFHGCPVRRRAWSRALPTPDGEEVDRQTKITWRSDGSVAKSGWKLCADLKGFSQTGGKGKGKDGGKGKGKGGASEPVRPHANATQGNVSASHQAVMTEAAHSPAHEASTMSNNEISAEDEAIERDITNDAVEVSKDAQGVMTVTETEEHQAKSMTTGQIIAEDEAIEKDITSAALDAPKDAGVAAEVAWFLAR